MFKFFVDKENYKKFSKYLISRNNHDFFVYYIDQLYLDVQTSINLGMEHVELQLDDWQLKNLILGLELIPFYEIDIVEKATTGNWYLLLQQLKRTLNE